MKQFSLKAKAVLSSLLLLLVIFLGISGAMLHFSKTGMVFGFARHTLRETHAEVALILGLLLLAHVFLNRRTYISELKSLVKRRN